MLLFLKNERVKEKFKKLENIDLMILCDEEPIFVSARFIQLLHCVKLDYTKDLNLLLEDKSLEQFYIVMRLIGTNIRQVKAYFKNLMYYKF